MSKEKTKLVLNQLVADLSQQAAIIHQVHWYMRGRGFITLHPAMDKLVGYEYLRGLYQEGLETAGEEGDDVSQDICIGFKGDIEKIIWMLRAHLNEAPGI